MGAGGSSSKATSTVSGSGTNRALVKRGWEAVEQKDYGKARQSFVDAAALNPTDGWAWYGLGYASEKQGDTRTAQNAYCKAKNVAGSNLDLTREVEGRITNGRFVCP
jgi:Flp pilus assembly protein TadD